MFEFLLDYFFKVSSISPTPQASTAFLKQVCLVVAPKGGVMTRVPTLCTSMSAVAALTNNVEAQQFFNAGMSRCYILPADDLDLAVALNGSANLFYTLLISSDFADSAIDPTQASGTITITSYANLVSGTADKVKIGAVEFTAQSGAVVLGEATFRGATSNDATAISLAAQINAHPGLQGIATATYVGPVVTIKAVEPGSAGNLLDLGYTDNDTNVGATKSGTKLAGGDGFFKGTYKGVVGIATNDKTKAAEYNTLENTCGFYKSGSVGSKNMCFAFGKLLSNSIDWKNQQFITMPYADDVATLGDAEALFDDTVGFVIADAQMGIKLSMFAAGGKAIVAPYVKRNYEIDLQSKALSFVSGNQPSYTLAEATLLENELNKVSESYLTKRWAKEAVARVSLEAEDFVVTSRINFVDAGAMWRVFASITSNPTT